MLPLSPTSITAVRSEARSLTIGWTAPADSNPPISNYNIQLSKDNGNNWFNVPKSISASTSSVIRNLDLSSGTWLARVRAVNADGAGPHSSPSAAADLSWTPDPPKHLKVTGGDSSITLSWTAPTNSNSKTG